MMTEKVQKLNRQALKKLNRQGLNHEQALNNGLMLKNVYRVIKINQKNLLKPYIDMNILTKRKSKK